jgi:hypothetical protein
MTLRLVSVEARGPHASRVDLGHLVFYTEGVPHVHQPRPRTVVRCARDTEVPLDLEAPRTGHRLHVHWFPYLRDRLCRGRRVQRRGGYAVIEDLRRPPERLMRHGLIALLLCRLYATLCKSIKDFSTWVGMVLSTIYSVILCTRT